MLVTVGFRQFDGGRFEIWAPDFPDCKLIDHDPDAAMTRMRLLIEGSLADRFLANQAEPELHDPAHWQRHAPNADWKWRQMHIHVGHIEAVARHQRGR